METKYYKRVLCYRCNSYIEDIEIPKEEFDRLMGRPLTKYVQEAGVPHVQVEQFGGCPRCQIDRLVAQLTAEEVTAVQALLIRICTTTNSEIGGTVDKFENAIRRMHEDPTLLRDLAPEFKAPVEVAINAAISARGSYG